MNLDRALQYNTAALAVMGALFLGLGHESVVLPVILTLAAILSVGLADRFRWLRLNRLVANLVALGAVCWSMRSFFAGVGTDVQLLAVADMLVYLQVVLLFQEKTGRVYWQLIVLSLLQVVVASALNLGPHFGFLLTAYMITALVGLVLLCSYREWRKFGTPARQPLGASTDWQRLLAEPAARAPQAADAALASARAAAVGWHVAMLAAATIIFAAVYFYSVPRHNEGAWANLRSNSYAGSGLMLHNKLEEYGRIHLSNQLVMRVTLTSAATGEPYALIGDPYFHGMALSDYVHDASGGRWIARNLRNPARLLPTSPVERMTPLTMLVHQKLILEGGSQQVCPIRPVVLNRREESERTAVAQASRLARFSRQEDQRESQFLAATSGLRNGRQLHGLPHHNPKITGGDKVLLGEEERLLLRFDPNRYPGLAATAERVVREAGVQAAGPLEQALALEQHFTESGLYRYSLVLDFRRDEQLDPIEDFVVNHRTGHCEYFASALVMMLRSRNIPARMVVGYKGGDFNTIGEYYQVRQKHAHAWVEALLPAGVAPAWELAGPPSGGGTWYRLDPTPSASRVLAEVSDKGLLTRITETFDYVELLWRDYVLSLNAQKQRDSIYDPTVSRTLASLPSWVEGRGLRRLLMRAARALGIDSSQLGPNRSPAAASFDWRSGSLLTGLLVGAIVAVQLLALLVRRLWSLRVGAGGSMRPRRKAPAFYRRLVALLARLPVRRAPGQTARELAADAAERLNHGGPQAGVAALPGEIVEAYYRVRFGLAALDSHEQAAIEHALAELSPAVRQAHR